MIWDSMQRNVNVATYLSEIWFNMNKVITYLSTVSAIVFHVEEINIPHIKASEFQMTHSK